MINLNIVSKTEDNPQLVTAIALLTNSKVSVYTCITSCSREILILPAKKKKKKRIFNIDSEGLQREQGSNSSIQFEYPEIQNALRLIMKKPQKNRPRDHVIQLWGQNIDKMMKQDLNPKYIKTEDDLSKNR